MLPGVAATQMCLYGCEIAQAGLHWLVADLNSGAAARLPLYVNTRAWWQEISNFEAVREHMRQHGTILPGDALPDSSSS